MTWEEKSRPVTPYGAASGSTRHRPQDIADIEARAERVEFALLVLSERADGVICSQLYTNLKAAERKVARTRERDLWARMTLVRLEHVSGWVA